MTPTHESDNDTGAVAADPSREATHVTAVDLYVRALIARWQLTTTAGEAPISGAGFSGLWVGADRPRARLVVTDDRAYDELARVSAEAHGMIVVFATAPRCAALLSADPRWRSSSTTAMVCHDLAHLTAVPLPDALQLRTVRRVATDAPDGVTLEAAVAAVIAAAPEEDPEQAIAFLRSLPAPTQLLAAVDAHGTVRATAGWQRAGAHAAVILVDTDPAWRRRGIAAVMTATALCAARDHGATAAILDATPAAESVYRRLGFVPAGPTLRFRAAAEP